MKKYIVTVREAWTQGIAIEAESEDEALELVRGGDGEVIEDLFEYSHPLEHGTSTVEECNA